MGRLNDLLDFIKSDTNVLINNMETEIKNTDLKKFKGSIVEATSDEKKIVKNFTTKKRIDDNSLRTVIDLTEYSKDNPIFKMRVTNGSTFFYTQQGMTIDEQILTLLLERVSKISYDYNGNFQRMMKEKIFSFVITKDILAIWSTDLEGFKEQYTFFNNRIVRAVTQFGTRTSTAKKYLDNPLIYYTLMDKEIQSNKCLLNEAPIEFARGISRLIFDNPSFAALDFDDKKQRELERLIKEQQDDEEDIGTFDEESERENYALF